MMERRDADAAIRPGLQLDSGWPRSSFPQVRWSDWSRGPAAPPLFACGMPTRAALVVLAWAG